MKKHLGGMASSQEIGVLRVDQEVMLAQHHLDRVQRSGVRRVSRYTQEVVRWSP